MHYMENIRSLTREYGTLQGLRTIPFGLFILALAPRKLGINWLGGDGDCTFTLPLFILGIALWLAIGRYYERAYGKVKIETSSAHQGFETVGILVLLVGSIIAENLVYRIWPGLSVSPIGATLAIIFLILGINYRRYYYTIFGALMAIISCLPLVLHTSVADQIYGTFGFVFSLVFGVGILLTGILDHLRLERSLRTLTEILDGNLTR